jgi:hypothetical protein
MDTEANQDPGKDGTSMSNGNIFDSLYLKVNEDTCQYCGVMFRNKQ